jgi:transcriptional regulator with XRE-family HTH domain
MALSTKAVVAIKLSKRRQYQLAQAAGVHPSTLSKLINGIERATRDDPKVQRLAEVLGIPSDEMIEEDAETPPAGPGITEVFQAGPGPKN